MCTLIVCSRLFENAPLVVAANRDERYARPAEGMTRRRIGEREVLAPRDLAGGGTWLGLNDRGVFVALTNRFGGAPDPSRRSRGQVVDLALAQADGPAASQAVMDLRAQDFNPFHLVVADVSGGWVVWSDGDELFSGPLERGALIVTERSFGAAPTGREALLRDALDEMGPTVPPDGYWVGLLSTHDEPSFDGVCVHWDEHGYGTRSSTVLRLDEWGRPTLLAADGPPCTTELTDLTAEARKLMGV